jgi:hypothetical protein
MLFICAANPFTSDFAEHAVYNAAADLYIHTYDMMLVLEQILMVVLCSVCC